MISIKSKQVIAKSIIKNGTKLESFFELKIIINSENYNLSRV